MRERLEILDILTTTGRHRVNKQCYQPLTIIHWTVNHLYRTMLINSSYRLNVQWFSFNVHYKKKREKVIRSFRNKLITTFVFNKLKSKNRIKRIMLPTTLDNNSRWTVFIFSIKYDINKRYKISNKLLELYATKRTNNEL